MKKAKSSKLSIDILLLAVLLLVSVFLFIGFRLFTKDGSYVIVRVDGEEKYSFSLTEEVDTLLEGSGGTNRIVIHGGEVYISDASCPDKLCVKEGKKHRSGESIICLPNKLVVEIKGENEKDSNTFDVITG